MVLQFGPKNGTIFEDIAYSYIGIRYISQTAPFFRPFFLSKKQHHFSQKGSTISTKRWRQNGHQNGSKSGPKMDQKVAPKWIKKWFQNGPKSGFESGPKSSLKMGQKVIRKWIKKMIFWHLSSVDATTWPPKAARWSGRLSAPKAPER